MEDGTSVVVTALRTGARREQLCSWRSASGRTGNVYGMAGHRWRDPTPMSFRIGDGAPIAWGSHAAPDWALILRHCLKMDRSLQGSTVILRKGS